MTLVEELEQAAVRAERMASACDRQAAEDPRMGGYSVAHVHHAEAARLRKRVAHVRKLQDQSKIKAVRTWVDALTGDL